MLALTEPLLVGLKGADLLLLLTEPTEAGLTVTLALIEPLLSLTEPLLVGT
jgi:MinD superfamily P-loop ATPase